MGNFGFNRLLEFSVYLLKVIYPVALLLIVMGISQELFNFRKEVFKLGAFTAVAIPLVEVLKKNFSLNLGFVTSLVKAQPMYETSLS